MDITFSWVEKTSLKAQKIPQIRVVNKKQILVATYFENPLILVVAHISQTMHKLANVRIWSLDSYERIIFAGLLIYFHF